MLLKTLAVAHADGTLRLVAFAELDADRESTAEDVGETVHDLLASAEPDELCDASAVRVGENVVVDESDGEREVDSVADASAERDKDGEGETDSEPLALGVTDDERESAAVRDGEPLFVYVREPIAVVVTVGAAVPVAFADEECVGDSRADTEMDAVDEMDTSDDDDMLGEFEELTVTVDEVLGERENGAERDCDGDGDVDLLSGAERVSERLANVDLVSELCADCDELLDGLVDCDGDIDCDGLPDKGALAEFECELVAVVETLRESKPDADDEPESELVRVGGGFGGMKDDVVVSEEVEVRRGEMLPLLEGETEGDGVDEGESVADRELVVETEGQAVVERETRAEFVTVDDTDVFAEREGHDVVAEAVSELVTDGDDEIDTAADRESVGVDDVLREPDGVDETLTDVEGDLDTTGERVDEDEIDGDREMGGDADSEPLASADLLSVVRPEMDGVLSIVVDRETADDADMLGESELERDARGLTEELGDPELVGDVRGDTE